MIAKKLLVGAFLILAGAGTALASAAPVDPSIILRDPATCPTGTTCLDIDINNFSFLVAPNGGGLFDITNNLGITITSLTFILHSQGGPVSCLAQDYFENCNESALTGDLIKVVFSGIGDEGCTGDNDEDSVETGIDSDAGNSGHHECDGIGSGDTFTVDLFNQGTNGDLGTGGWVGGSTVSGIVNTPEPGTLLLLLTAVPLIGLRKRQ